MDSKLTIEKVMEAEDFFAKVKAKSSIPVNPVELFKNNIQNLTRNSIGPMHWLIIDYNTLTICAAGGNPEKLVGHSSEEFINQPLDSSFKNVYEKDKEALFSYALFAIQQLAKMPFANREELKISIYVRLYDKNKQLRWGMINYNDWLFGNDNQIQFLLCSTTDITHIYGGTSPKLTIYQSSGNTCNEYFTHSPEDEKPKKVLVAKLTKRQKEIAKLLAEGLTSKQIGEKLNLSPNTVNNHRNRLLHITNSNNVTALIRLLYDNGQMM